MTSMAQGPVSEERGSDAIGGFTPEDLELIRQRYPTADVDTRDAPTIAISSDRLLDLLTTSSYELGGGGGGCGILSDLTAVDLGHFGSPGKLRVSYLLGAGQARLRIDTEIEMSAALLPTATGLWPAAAWCERELHEMFGIQFSEHPRLRRLLTPDRGSPIHPLRKSCPLRGDRLQPGIQAGGEPQPAPIETPPPGAVQLEIHTAGPVLDAALQLHGHVDGNDISAVFFEPGFVHSGFEKLAEQRTYRQCVALAERLNHCAPYGVGLAFAMAAESLLGIEPPLRAQYGRVIFAELARISSHLRALAGQATAAGSHMCAAALLEQLEAVRDLFAVAEGRRSASGRTRIGGLVEDLPSAFANEVTSTLARIGGGLKALDTHLMRNRAWRRRMDGAGVIEVAEALAWGVSGPLLRASGLARDVRKTDPYLTYAELDFEIPVGSSGDAVDRCRVRRDEIEQSVSIVSQACGKLPEGAFRVEDHKVSLPAPDSLAGDAESLIHHFELLMNGHGLRPPAGAQVYAPTEAAEGELGFFLMSDGTDRPYRCHLRSPSFFHGQIVERLLTGCKLPAAESVFVSMNIIAAEMDR